LRREFGSLYLLTHLYNKAWPLNVGLYYFYQLRFLLLQQQIIKTLNPALKNNFVISTDTSDIDIAVVYNYLSRESYWAKNISIDTVTRAIENSFCFGIYKKETAEKNTQVGFARVITDKATFGYLADVFILEHYRGIGLSKWLMYEILNHPELQGFRSWMLGTKDAHGLYEQFGFKRLQNSERIMRLGLMDGYPEMF
jgi:GNAT superfamily N-acetyltransferase